MSQCSASFTLLSDSSGTIYGVNTSFADTSEWYVYDASGALINVSSSWDLTHPTSGGPAVYTVCLYTYIGPSWTFCDSACQTITVIGGGSSCDATFTSYPDTTTPGAYFFNGTASGGAPPYTCTWSFGDGATGALFNEFHTYASSGSYTVCLTIADAVGCISTICSVVSVSLVSASCNASFVSVPDMMGNYEFWNLSSGSGLSYFWSFGDGASSSLENPVHSYSASGSYTVCLSAWNSAGCADTVCNNIIVVGSGSTLPCNSDFIWFPDTSSNTVYLWNLASGSSGLSYYWDFGDGGTSNLAFPSHSYAANGTYLVCLTVSDSTCTSVFCDSVSVPLKSSGFTINVVPPGGATQVEERQTAGALSNVRLYPNPAIDNLVLTYTSGESFHGNLRIYSSDGKLWGQTEISASRGANEEAISLKHLPSGLYLILINKGGGNEAFRVVKR